jgi:hypothetical protein
MMEQTYTLVTGASKGIGKSIANECAKCGHNLILVARSQQELDSVAADIKTKFAVDIKVYALDLSLPEAAGALFNWCTQQNLKVSMLVNDAGYSLWGEFGQIELAKQLNLIDVNIKALVSLCYKFLPMLRESKNARILNVASLAGTYPIPYLNVYAASKAFVISFSKSLRYELRATGVKVSCLCPGGVATNFWRRSGMESSGKDSPSGKMSADSVARTAVKGMISGKAIIVPGIINKMYAPFLWLFPSLAMRVYAAMINP